MYPTGSSNLAFLHDPLVMYNIAITYEMMAIKCEKKTNDESKEIEENKN